MKNRILFIEHIPDLSDILRFYLENHYYLALSKNNEDAFNRLKKDDNIKLIIYNNEPSVNNNGLDFLKLIRKNHYYTPLILLSDEYEKKEEIEIIKNTLFLNKNSDIEAILQIIETIIPKKSPKEKRKFPRVNINKSVEIFCMLNQKKINTLIENISLDGMRIKISGKCNDLDYNVIEFCIDDYKIIISKVKIIYCEKCSENEYVYGIKFIEINENSLNKIQNLVTHYIKKSIITSEINM